MKDAKSVKLYRIRKVLAELTQKSGSGTELITVYIPKGKQLHEIITILKEEQGTADNIKSDITRTHVVDSLGKVVQRLKLYKKTPERGLVIFCGALAPKEGGPIGNEVVRIFEIDPPKELKTFLYRCDDHFHVDILKDMLQDDNSIGILAIDAKDAGWGLLRGDKIEVLASTGSGVAGKHRQGGQSAKRFQKLREMELTYYFNRVAKTTKEYFIDIHKVKGLIVSGPGPTKEDFVNNNYLEYRLQDMILSVIDASYAGSEGIREAFDKSKDVLVNFRLVEEKVLVEKLFQKINTQSGLGAYGLDEVIELLMNNVTDIVLVTDKIDKNRIEMTCNKCKGVESAIVKQNETIKKQADMKAASCPKCKSSDLSFIITDIIDYISLHAAERGVTVEVISGKSEYGVMLESLGSVGAILRYNPMHSK
ncbi:MAG: peptide chain release factor aRF-1 [Candidatus Nitrosoabyssus spongiisocia]|nr:MAG: peptide chain release factor aRF-1 [Nitrosopumilaceae archaeon AB1(1)]